MDCYQTALVVNGSNSRITAGPCHGSRHGAARNGQREAVAVLDPAGLIYDGQSALARRANSKCRLRIVKGVVSAILVGDGDLVSSHGDPVRGRVISKCILCLRNHTALVVLDRDGGLVHLAVILDVVGHELDDRCGHSLRVDGHLVGQLCARHIIVVAVALHPVPDIIIARVGAGGEAGGIVGAVHRVLQSAACCVPRHRNQCLGKSGVHQPGGRRGRSYICYLRLKDRRSGGNRGDDFVLCVDIVRESQAVNDDSLVLPDILIREMSLRFRAGNAVAGNQAAADGDGQVGIRIAIVGPVCRRHNGRDLLFVRIERPSSGLVVVAGFGAGGCDRDRPHAGNREQSRMLVDTGRAVIDLPSHCPVAACGPQLDGVAVVDTFTCVGDGQRRLACRGDLEHVVNNSTGKIVVAAFTGNAQGVCAYLNQVAVVIFIQIGHRVLAAVDQQAAVVLDGDRWFLLLAVERHRGRRHLDGGVGHGVLDDGSSYRLCFAVAVVVVALGLVPDGVGVNRLPGGDGRSIRAVLGQGVDHSSVGSGARLNQRLLGAVVGQVFQPLRSRRHRRGALRDFKGPRTVYDVVAAVGVGDDDRRRAGVDVVAVGQGVLGVGDGVAAVLHLDISGTRLLCASVIGIGATGHRDLRTDHFLGTDGHGDRTGLRAVNSVVAVAHYLVMYHITACIGLCGDGRLIVAVTHRIAYRVLDVAARGGARVHQLLGLSGVGQAPDRLGSVHQLCAALANLKCHTAIDNVVAAVAVRDGGGGVTHIPVVAVGDHVLAGRNDHRTVFDDSRGDFIISIILIVIGSVGVRLQAVAGQGGIRGVRCQRFPADGHRDGLGLGIVVVGVALCLVPDRVISRVGPGGHCRGIDAVPGVGVEGVRISAGHKGLGRAGVRQGIRCYGWCLSFCLEDGRGGGGRDGDGVLLGGGVIDRSAGDVHRLAGAGTVVLKLTRYVGCVDGVAANQVTRLPGDNKLGGDIASLIHPVLRGDNGRNRLFPRVERIGCFRLVIVAAARLGRSDCGGTHSLDGHKAVGVDVSNRAIAAAPCDRAVAGAAYRAEGEGVAVVDEAGLVDNLQRGLGRCADYKVSCSRLNDIVAAGDVLNLDRVCSLIRPVLAGIINIRDLILGGWDYVVRFIPDNDLGPLYIAVILCAGGRQLDFGRHSLLVDGHLHRFDRAVRVVAVALGLEVDRVGSGVLGLGDGGVKIGAVVQGIDHGSAGHSARRDQLLVLAYVVGQGVGSRVFIHRRGLCQNGRGGGLRNGNGVFIRIITIDVRIRAVHCHLLGRAHAVSVKHATQIGDRDGVSSHQLAVRHDCGYSNRFVTGGIGPVHAGQHSRHRLLAHTELPLGGYGAVVGPGTGHCDNVGPAHVPHGEQSSRADGAGAGDCTAVLGRDLPGNRPRAGAACYAQLDVIAIAHLGLAAVDDNALLVRRDDLEGSGVVNRTIVRNDIIGGVRRDNLDGVLSYIFHIIARGTITLDAGNRHRVLTLRNQPPAVIRNGDNRLLLTVIERELILGQRDAGGFYLVFANAYRQAHRGGVAVVCVAQHLVVDVIRADRRSHRDS